MTESTIHIWLATIISIIALIIAFFYRRKDKSDEKFNKIFDVVENVRVETKEDRDRVVADLKQEQNKTATDLQIVKFNYVKKFEDVTARVNKAEVSILKAIDVLKDDISEKFVSRAFCQYVQDQKKK
jgi:hypothetical protein